jgi:crossover junction endodeoxyribonuclease RuvC
VGLDLSLTGTGVAILRLVSGQWAKPELHTVRPLSAPKGPVTRQYEGARLFDVASKIVSLGVLKGTALVGIEDYAYGISMDQTNCVFQLGELGGVVRYLLFQAGVPYAPINISVGKKFATGNGSAKKDMVAAKMSEMWKLPLFAKNQYDSSDALALGSLAAYKMLNGLPGLQTYRFQEKLADQLEIVNDGSHC